jgi:hypothetical protein
LQAWIKALGLAISIARPGDNVTGIWTAGDQAYAELDIALATARPLPNVSIADAKAELLVTQVARKSAVASTIMLYHDVNRLKQSLQNISESFKPYTP